MNNNLPTIEHKINEYHLPYESLIGGWTIPENECDVIIDYFKKSENKSVGIGYSSDKGKTVNKDFKDSIDIGINLHLTSELLNYGNYLKEILDRYKQKYFYSNCVNEYRVYENVNIQYYKSNGGFKIWHFENNGEGSNLYRHLVFMTYLNDLDNGGTEFLYQGLKVPAKKGLTIIWPATWTHTHKGIISKTQEKMIITGWFSFKN
jgi:hypothetical protein